MGNVEGNTYPPLNSDHSMANVVANVFIFYLFFHQYLCGSGHSGHSGHLK